MMDEQAKQARLRQEYMSRINRVLDHTETNIDSELKRETLAKVANLSRVHFHRIFDALLDETIWLAFRTFSCSLPRADGVKCAGLGTTGARDGTEEIDR